MRNRFPGTCYVCGKRVEKGQGHFERTTKGTLGWRVQCFTHPIEKRQQAIAAAQAEERAWREEHHRRFYASDTQKGV